MSETIECPVCKLHIVCTEAKDFESFSGREYAQHVKDAHPEQVSAIGIPYGRLVAINGEPL